MLVLSDVLLILASFAGITSAGIFDGFIKPACNNSNPAVRAALTTFGKGLLSGLLKGAARGPPGGSVDPRLANVLTTFGKEFEDKPGENSIGTRPEAWSAATTAGYGGSKVEADSSEEKNKGSRTNAVGSGTTEKKPQKSGSTDEGESGPEKPAKPATTESGSQTPESPLSGHPGQETPANPTSAVPGFPGAAGKDVARNVGTVAGTAIATTLLGAIMESIKRAKEKKEKAKLAGQYAIDRREKRSLVDDTRLMGAKGALKGSDNVPDFSNSFYCGRHEMPNTVGAQDRFCHPSATWNTTLRLLPDCVCQPGFLRNSWGECISARECDLCRSKHRFNMDYHVCGSPCPIVCNQRINEYCPNTCVRKCACRPGYIRKYPNGPCVSLKECLPGCRGRNQIFSFCSSLCPPTCRRPVPKRCPKICAGEGCVCKPGFVVKTWEPLVCVRPKRCPGRRRKCKGPNQVYTRCRRRCPPSCFGRNRNRYCGKDCVGRGCVCKRGFVVLQWRPLVCVRANQCPARRKKCPAKNQIYKYCKSKCPPTCADKKPRKCGAACSGEGCACKPGFVIKQHNPLICVRRSRCRFNLKRPNRGNVRRGPRPSDPFPWSFFSNEF